MAKKKSIHVIGTGTIGEPLIGILVSHAKHFGLEEVTFHKRTPLKTDRSKVKDLLTRGAKLAVDDDRLRDFKAFGIEPTYTAEQALEQAAVVIDCTPVGNENKEKLYLRHASNTLGFIAQGSEFGFGKMYARGINDAALKPGEDKFVQVVSCNTHNLAVILDTVAFRKGTYSDLESAKFLCIRRSNDISQDDSYCPSPTVNKHDDPVFGSHHAHDVFHLYETLGVKLPGLFSSAIKLNTQYMHTIHFQVKLKRKTSIAELQDTMKKNDRIAVTYKTSANSVFSFGRDHGHFGRILNQTVFVLPSLHVSQDGQTVTGFCFTPQDGNPLLSSVSAALWFLDPKSYEDKIQVLKPYFFEEV
jgi:glyceraldehyde-3-phosphate dehydrogenase (NAD(P))